MPNNKLMLKLAISFLQAFTRAVLKLLQFSQFVTVRSHNSGLEDFAFKLS